MEYESADYDLTDIRDSIEQFNKFNQIEVLKILKRRNDVVLNENKNGIYVNLSDVSPDAINQLLIFIEYVNKQEASLTEAEEQKLAFKTAYFSAP
jgi:hypothetical protein